jgi:hypothetical protein
MLRTKVLPPNEAHKILLDEEREQLAQRGFESWAASSTWGEASSQASAGSCGSESRASRGAGVSGYRCFRRRE